MSFGNFIKMKRQENDITLRGLALLLNISPPYLSDIEKDRRNPFDKDKLEELTVLLKLTKAECDLMYDLAAANRNSLPVDIQEYIKDSEYLISAIRKVKALGATKDDWDRFIEKLEREE